VEIQLQELITKIKDEGVLTAKTEAEAIIAQANAEAKAIVDKANQQVKEALEEVKKAEEIALQRQQEALAQAGRDLILSIRQKLFNSFDMALTAATKEVTVNSLEELIKVALGSLDKESGYEIDISNADADKMYTALKAKFADMFKGGLDIKASSTIDSGFRLGVKDGSALYDITDEAIVSNLKHFLSPKLAEDFRKATLVV